MHRNIKLTPLLDTIQFIEMSDEEYFSKVWADYISNSRLKLINPEQGGSPEAYLEGLHSQSTDSLVFGSAVHEMLLQPDSFEVVDTVDRPTAKAGLMADKLFDEYKKSKELSDDVIIAASDEVDYYKGKMNDKKIQDLKDKVIPYFDARIEYEESHPSDKEFIYLDARSRDKLYKCLFSVSTCEEIKALLHPQGLIETPISRNEAALFMDVKAELDGKETILKLKGKLDNFTYDTEQNKLVLNDLKTTGHLLVDFRNSFNTYHYARQMAMYMWMLKQWAEKEYEVKPTLESNMLLVSTIPDFRAGVFPVTDKHMAAGLAEFKDLLQRVAYIYLK